MVPLAGLLVHRFDDEREIGTLVSNGKEMITIRHHAINPLLRDFSPGDIKAAHLSNAPLPSSPSKSTKQCLHFLVHHRWIGECVCNLVAQQLAVLLAQPVDGHAQRSFIHCKGTSSFRM